MNRRNLVWLAPIIAVSPVLGCQTNDHPWSGEPYREPTGYSNPTPSIYAPMPSILPSIEGTENPAVVAGEGVDPILDLESME